MRRRRLNAITQSKSIATRLVNSVAGVVTKRYFLPSSLPGCQLWLDAADNSSLVIDGTNVTTWRDKSGNGYHMNTLTGNAGWTGSAVYPTIGTSINGLQTVNFKAQGGLKQSTTLDGVKNLFWVGRIEAPTGSGGANSYFLFGHDNFYDWHATPYGGRFVDYVNVQGGIYNGTTSLFTSDSSAVTNTSLGGAFTPTAPSISLLSVTGITGSTRYQGICYDRNGGHIGWCGDLAEVITFSTALTTAQRQAVEGYLAHKWGITQYYSPVTPLSIPGCSIWLDAADTSSLTLSGSTVTTWRDKSGNGNNFTSVIGSTSVTTDNGMNVVNFSANDAVMRSTNQVPLTTSSAIFVVSKLLSINGSTFGYILALPEVNAWDDYSFRYRDGSSLIGTRAYGGGGVDGDIGNGNYYVNGVFDPTGGGQFLNKYSVISTIKPGRSGTTRVLLSSSSSGRYFKGYIAEFLYYSGGVTLSQRETIEKYLMQKWGLGLLPLSHPYVNYIPAPTVFIPPSIAQECRLWLDGADTTSVTLSGSNVTQIRDKSGNGYTFTGSAGTSPTRTATLNDLPVISSAAGQFVRTTNFNQNFTTVTCFIVMRPTEDITPVNKWSNGYPLYNFISGGFGCWINYANQTQNPGDNTRFTASIGSSASLLYGALGGSSVSTYNPVNTTLLISGVLSGTSATNSMFLNGSPINLVVNTSGLPPLISSLTMDCIGNPNGQSFGYNFAEAILYGTTLTTSQRAQVEGYLAWKWGLQSTLPSTHLYKSIAPIVNVTFNPFLPTLIPGCQIWLDGADPGGGGIQPANGTVLSSWNDKSGFGRHAAPAGSPTYSSVGINGKAGISLGSPNFFQGSLSNTTNTLSVFTLVYHTTFVGNDQRIVSLGVSGQSDSSSSLYCNPVTTYGTTPNRLATSRNNATINDFGTITPGTLFLTSTVYNGTDGRLYVNGTLASFSAPTSSTGNFGYSNYTIGRGAGGGTDYFRGLIGEVIIYHSALTTTERQQVESYLAWKWGLQGSLPSDHTYKFAPPSV